MTASTIRIRPKSHQLLKEMAALTGQSLQDVLDQAIEDRRRRLYLEGLKADYQALTARDRAELEKENSAWDCTNLDGLEKL